MNSIHQLFSGILIITVFSACDSNKPKPVSKNITKTTVMVGGKKDSVINNPQKNYGSATISDPCAKILLKNIQSTDSYKQLLAGKAADKFTYVLNWVKAEEPKMRTNGGKITNGIEVVVNQKVANGQKKLASYLFNNEDDKLYYINNNNQYDELSKVDSNALKQMRNGCYWGVASHQ